MPKLEIFIKIHIFSCSDKDYKLHVHTTKWTAHSFTSLAAVDYWYCRSPISHSFVKSLWKWSNRGKPISQTDGPQRTSRRPHLCKQLNIDQTSGVFIFGSLSYLSSLFEPFLITHNEQKTFTFILQSVYGLISNAQDSYTVCHVSFLPPAFHVCTCKGSELPQESHSAKCKWLEITILLWLWQCYLN